MRNQLDQTDGAVHHRLSGFYVERMAKALPYILLEVEEEA